MSDNGGYTTIRLDGEGNLVDVTSPDGKVVTEASHDLTKMPMKRIDLEKHVTITFMRVQELDTATTRTCVKMPSGVIYCW